MRLRLAILLAAVVLLAPTGAALAQTTGEIFGRVIDGSGAVLPGASITLSGPTLLQPLTSTATETGTYRFSQVPIGTYTLRFELPGFRTVVREGIRVEIGFSAQVNATLEVSSMEEEITVTGESPVVDARKTGAASTFTQEQLQAIPSSRDPWVMLEQTPSIALDRANVGGTQSGQQAGYVARGAGTGNNVWKLDGVNITDMNATGASSIYFNFDAFEEMQFSTAGNDVTQATGGVGVNLVTKSGTDRFRGSARYLITDEQFQGDNVDDELREQGATSGNPIQQIKDYGFDIGGPILRGRAWFWGAYGKQDINVGILGFYKKQDGCPGSPGGPNPADMSTKEIRKCLQADTTVLDNYDIKGQVLLFQGNKATWYSNFAEKFRNARDASDVRPPETVYVQKGPVWTHKFSDQQIFSDRWLAELQVARVGGNFSLDFPNPGEQFSIQRRFDVLSGAYARSFSQSLFDRPILTFDLKSTYFVPGWLGGDHNFKVGYEWRDTDAQTYSHVGGYATARFANGVPDSADMHRDAFTLYELRTQSAYAQDTFTRGRLTVMAGVRYDWQKDVAKGATVDANPIIPDILPGASFDGADPGVVFKTLSPRFGLTYDISGRGKTIASFSASRYYGQLGSGGLASTLNPLTAVTLRYRWNDLNGDELVSANELDLSRILAQGGNYNPANPSSPTTINRIADDLEMDTTDEIVVGLQHELMSDLAVSANYIWRKYDNMWRTDIEGITSDDYVEVTTTPTGCFSGGGQSAACPSVTYFNPTTNTVGLPRILSMASDYSRSYNGIELELRKRYSHRWQANVSVAYNDATRHYDSPRSYVDPTNIDKLDDAQHADQSGGSGIDNVWVNARWLFKASGLYTFPWDINVSAFLNTRQGYLFPEALTIRNRPNGGGNVDVLLEKYGESRHPNFAQLDVKVEKAFHVRQFRFKAGMSAFNVLNANTVMARRRIVNASNYLNVSQILSPRVVQFGVKMEF